MSTEKSACIDMFTFFMQYLNIQDTGEYSIAKISHFQGFREEVY